jgi:hypothetical protein
LCPQIIDRGLEQILFLCAIENRDASALRPKQECRGSPAQACTKDGDILIFVTQFLPQFQGRQTQQRADDRENPKSNDDRVFLPTSQLEMVMKRGHDENSSARQLEAEHLQNYRDRFEHENATHDYQEQFLFTTNSDYANHAADRERSGIAHENLGRVTVEPEKAKTRTNQCGTDYR